MNDYATTFGKVDYSDYLSFLKYVMYGRFANAHINKTFRTPPTFYAKSMATDDEGKAVFTLSVDKFDEREIYH